MIELKFLKELMLIRQSNQKSVIFVTIGISLMVLSFSQPNVCNRCYDLLMRSVNLSNIAILSIKSADCRCIIGRNSKNGAINLMKNADLTEEGGTL